MSASLATVELETELIELRRAIHRQPELGLNLPNTQRLILEALGTLPLEISTGDQLSSVVAVLRGVTPGPTVLLRGDMDALPVSENVDVAFRSEVEGAMHACGHDLHVAILVGAARILADRRSELLGDVLFMFQPGEEGFNGARKMIEEGLLAASGSTPIAAYALHVLSSNFESGVVYSRVGPIMAASDVLTVTVRGSGGHGSAPHLAKDPVNVACEIVNAVQSMVTRSFDVFDPVVVTVGSFHAGTKANVIPDEARFEATVRSFSSQNRDHLESRLPRLVHGIAEGHGLSADVSFEEQYRVMTNDADEAAFLRTTVENLLGPDGFCTMPAPLTGSEDFSEVLDRIPGAYAMIGACPPGADPAGYAYNHSPEAWFDENTIIRGAEVLAELAVRRLAEVHARG
jgi:hippurate hydrolase